jgi:hypothetical protein
MLLMILAFHPKSQGLRRVVTLFVVVDDDEDDEQLFSFSETTRLGHITLTSCRYFYKVSA